MTTLKNIFGGNLQQYTMVLALVLLAVTFNVISGGRMLTPSNLQNLISGNAYVLILAIGMVMVIVVGHIDLSVGSVAGFVGMVTAITTTQYGWPWWVGLLAGLLTGVVIGAWHGFWLAKIGIPGFITTLAGMMIFRGLVIWVSRSISVPVPSEFSVLGAGYLPEWGPAFTGMNNSTLLLGLLAAAWFVWTEIGRRRDATDLPVWITAVRIVLVLAVIGYLTFLFGTGRPGTSFPVPGLILVGLVIVYHVLTQRTPFGRHIYAVGGNKAAAALSGVNTGRVYFLVMLNMSFLAAVAGILFVGRATAAGPSDGTMWELDAIAAVFIGGAAVSGGIGTVTGSMIGGLVMAVLNNGLMLMGVGQDQTQVIKGLVLLAAVAFDVLNKQQGRPSLLGHLTRSAGRDAGPAPAATAPAATASAAATDAAVTSVPVSAGPVDAGDTLPPRSS